jgi:hypothetical protein
VARNVGRIKLQLQGFDGMLEQIQAAGGDIDRATNSCIRQSAQIMHTELIAAMQSTGADGGLIAQMDAPEITADGNRYSAKVGYKMGSFDPNNPSAGYKALFYNYGTPRRTKHGKEAARGYIAIAKKKARPKIKKAQKETLEKILERVNK